MPAATVLCTVPSKILSCLRESIHLSVQSESLPHPWEESLREKQPLGMKMDDEGVVSCCFMPCMRRGMGIRSRKRQKQEKAGV